ELRLAGTQPRLDQLQIPVAQLAVDEVVEGQRGVREVIAVDPGVDLSGGPGQAREDPAVLNRRRSSGERARGIRPRRIPKWNRRSRFHRIPQWNRLCRFHTE